MRGQGVVIACDPGKDGAFAVTVGGALVDVDDMPTLTLTIAGKQRRRVDGFTVHTLLRSYLASHFGYPGGVLFVLEEVGAMPKEGPQGAFTFGESYGVVKGVAIGLGVPIELVRPAQWKRDLKLRKGKDAARLRAMELFPQFRADFKRVKDDGRAEAALIAHWAHQTKNA